MKKITKICLQNFNGEFTCGTFTYVWVELTFMYRNFTKFRFGLDSLRIISVIAKLVVP